MAPSADREPISGESSPWADPDDLRTQFTLAMSAMYQKEVPLYGDLVRIVGDLNKAVLDDPTGGLDPYVVNLRYGGGRPSPGRLDIERHGAIRLGSAEELRTMRRVFAIIGLCPVGYYDLSIAGLPMHATTFRPVTEASLRRNPFRVFTSVLRPELVRDETARKVASKLVSQRDIFSKALLKLLDTADVQDGRLTKDEGDMFVAEALKTFMWQPTAAATHSDYRRLKAEHPILADIACFSTCHINHLTPRTLDIVACQNQMREEGLKVKDRIEGPPLRSCPILLRQTSFLAVEEKINFLTSPDKQDSPIIQGSHKARFGEIEERGAAVTPRGRKLYDDILNGALIQAQQSGLRDPEQMDSLMQEAFKQYPDKWDELRKQGLIYCSYQCKENASGPKPGQEYTIDTAIEHGFIEAVPLTYEDFLPLSAAGIFQSNLGSSGGISNAVEAPDLAGLETALGTSVECSEALYEGMQDRSIAECASKLGIQLSK